MEFFDSHCHVHAGAFDEDRDAVLARAAEHGVSMLTQGTDRDCSRRAAALAAKHPHVYAAVGIHPNDTGDAQAGDLNVIQDLTKSNDKVRAIGEIGLDYYWKRVAPAIQKRYLEEQFALALELELPVVLHARDSVMDVLEMTRPFVEAGGVAVWHCFLASKKILDRALDEALGLGLYLGISGLITHEEQRPLRRAVARIPDRHLLLDTDAPYLQPKPKTLTRNEPHRCIRIAEVLAELRGVSLADMARITTRNARAFLKLPDADEAGKIAYAIRDSLYIALTNDCNNNCTFCARQQGYVVKGHDIRLDHDPTAAEVLAAIDQAGGMEAYREAVFCGFGEPTLRLPVLLEVAKALKARGARVRLNTNGQANLEHGRDVTPELATCVDAVSISLNTTDPVAYDRLCRSRHGVAAHQGLQDFARACAAHGIETTLTVVAMPGIDVDAARTLADNLGVGFRARSFVDAG